MKLKIFMSKNGWFKPAQVGITCVGPVNPSVAVGVTNVPRQPEQPDIPNKLKPKATKLDNKIESRKGKW